MLAGSERDACSGSEIDKPALGFKGGGYKTPEQEHPCAL